ncbi:Aste57867_10391 [Aphanomyces stellatus]|uniref:Aste57867_10391 protein n=1 Tax=Aphanomyces stellatus TaxID=120398 RepID=A0A485KQS3_9STRA|nr:hypothetical protein As57867_010351 [Aphanomyces stellatus]VFT87265.1 Aste57867_10391 [Aphanomyces stellatus]
MLLCFLCAVLVLVDALSCPYDSLPPQVTTILIADASLCPPQVEDGTCVVDCNCSVVNTTAYQAVGRCLDLAVTSKFTEYPMTIDSIDNSGYMSFALAQFPDHISYMYVGFVWARCEFIYHSEINNLNELDVPESFHWPRNVTQMHFNNNRLPSLPQLPPTIKSLHLTNNSFSNPKDFEALPSSIIELEVIANKYTAVRNVNWCNMTSVKLSGIQHLDNVVFGPKLTYLYIDSSSVQSWVMNQATFNVLNQLTPIALPGRASAGFDYSNLTINTPQIACSAANGKQQEIWPNRVARQVSRGVVEPSTPFIVCITPGKSTTNMTNKYTTTAFLGLAVLTLLALVYMAIFARRWMMKINSCDCKAVPMMTESHASILRELK